MLKKIKQKFIGFLKQGITPKQLAIAVALGICLGIIPLLGSTSLLCMAAAFSFRLNMAAIQAVNYLIYPLQLLLYIPFLKAGAYLCQEKFNYSLSDITVMLSEKPWDTIQKFFQINLYALLLWILIAAVLYVLLYFIFLKSFTALEKTLQKTSQSSPEQK